MGREGEVKVKSLQKAMEVLECFTQKQPLGVTEISEKLGLYKSNVHNILMTFTSLGYLTQDDETGKFHLGVSLMKDLISQKLQYHLCEKLQMRQES